MWYPEGSSYHHPKSFHFHFSMRDTWHKLNIFGERSIWNLAYNLRFWGWPVLSSSGILPDLWTCRKSLALLRNSHTAPACSGSLKVSSSPASFHVRKRSPTDTPIDVSCVTPGRRRKLWGPVKVTATETGSAHEKVTFPWDRWRGGEVETKRGIITQAETSWCINVNLYRGWMLRPGRTDLISEST